MWIGPVAGSGGRGNEPFGCMKIGEFVDELSVLLASVVVVKLFKTASALLCS